jgi:hypothetical protein
MIIWLVKFNTKLGRGDIFKPTSGNGSIPEICKDNNGVAILPHANSNSQEYNIPILSYN